MPEVINLIKSSGNSFHGKVASYFIEHEWSVTVSPYYLDQNFGKAREIDLIAEKRWPVSRHSSADYIPVRLFIECKFIPVNTLTVFWFADKDQYAAKKLVCSIKPFKDNNDNMYTSRHHYISQSPQVAKLFASGRSQEHGKLKEPENEPFYKAINQVLHGMVSLRWKNPKIPEHFPTNIKINQFLDFSVVICSSFESLYKTDFYHISEPNPIPILENFQLEIQYAYIDRNKNECEEYFLLDIVSFEKIDEYIATIENDVKAAIELLS